MPANTRKPSTVAKGAVDDPFTDPEDHDGHTINVGPAMLVTGRSLEMTPPTTGESKAAHPGALVGTPAPVALPGLGLAERAARQLTDEDLIDALHQIAHRVQSIPAADRAAVLREAAHRIRS